ncbi:PVC-type heme-binding CxxCH protein [Pedosphaera parvula]|uniref:Membrane-bound dehydrogenase domain protein n=1 Tax=Pedosphaera parvula (strain Ellin514) TaxID=320771 RepID=B9XM42_PEDPL|nr:PVC-type heme-binding CxxCH protein [Pedosphaera parvula]EEF59035.1 membrane-bound dehydrogenase domain protein [Pedosphaera parvula Ellin514]
MKLKTLTILLIAFCASFTQAQPSSKLELKKGDHIAIIGNGLADRFQHSGWLETLIYSKYPQHDLVFRNLAVAGDEISVRNRSENFGSPDEWLKKTKADVILAFFGFNESFKGHDGVGKFKADLDKFLKDTLANDYSGKGHPRIVLFSPIACEKHQDSNLPDPIQNNANLQEYTAAMAEVARANGVQFIDLFGPSQHLYAEVGQRKQSLTVDGFHLSEAGDKLLADAMFQGLFGEKIPATSIELRTGNFERLRLAVNEKNAEWHARYRTVDGYNVYGGRSALAYEPGKGGFISDRNASAPYISNYRVMQEEMSQRDVLTANRDKRVWAVAKGGDLVVDDSNLPPVEKVRSNRPGSNPDESYPFLGGEAAIAKMTVHSGMKVNLFASEEQFPELANPVQMAWDTKGRLWVAAWRNYPERTPDSKVGDSLIILEDTNGDGKADKCTEFIGDLNAPTGFQFYKDGVLLMQAPDLWFVRDRNGDGKADWKERVLMGMDSADSHHTANAICLDPGGSIYLSDGVFHRSQVETAKGPVRNNDAAIYRYEPRTGRFETYVSYGFANPHGRVFDYWGNDLITDATGNNTYFGPAFSGHIDYPAKHSSMKEFWNRPSRPCPGTGIINSRHFPEEFQGNFMNLNVIGFQGIYLVKVTEEGSGLKGETQENLISSSDPNFRPSAVSIGPDGAIYFCDWQKPLIGHMQHHLRDPNRDHEHGRIYRITYEGRPLLKPAKIDGQPIPALLELLKEPENRTRELAKVELGKRNTKEVIAAVKKWVTKLDKNDPAYEHHIMEALWVHQWHNSVDADLLKRMLHSPEPRARAAAGRVLCYWRDRVPEAITLFKSLADDENPRVRLEAVRAASFFQTAESVDVALTALKHPTDYYLDYTLHETLRQLDPVWHKAIAAGQPLAADNPDGLKYLLRSINTPELMKLPRTRGVLEALFARPDAADPDRLAALTEIAKARQTTRVSVLLGAIDSANETDSPAAAGFARLLPWQLPDELKAERAHLTKLTSAKSSMEVRQAAWAGLALADNSFDTVWSAASKSPAALVDLLNGIPLLNDSDFRAKAYGKVKPLLTELPADLQTLAKDSQNFSGRFVRIELPRRGTLTLAEVQVFSDGKNVALQGKAKQSSTTNGGEAARAIDGRTDGDFGSGTQTHSKENEDHPWWEVDLGSSQHIDSIVVWNRTEGEFGNRLEGFTLTVLGGDRREVFKKMENPAPIGSARIAIGGDPIGSIRRAAVRASVSMNFEPEAVFTALAGMIDRGEQVPAVAEGMRALPRASWPKPQAGSAATALVAWAKTVSAGDRTSQDYVQTVQLASDLAGLLPAEKAAELRKDLRELRVSVFVIRTVREQMRYDSPRLVVEAGKPFEIIFENGDFMPHNFVIVKPGTREKVGNAAATMKPDELDGEGRAYIPKTADILAATKLLESGQKATLKLTAPVIEGDHEYVCTFPGHYQVMWGQLVVTKDVEAYLQAHPEATLPVAATSSEHVHHHDQ